jgi:hypothetical protein
MTLWLTSCWFQTVINCSCWQTSIGQPVLFEYGTGYEWHPSNQTLQCPVVTIRCYPWSAGSWEVFHIVGLCVFSHQSADYSIVVAHLTSNSFEGHPCCMHADYLPSLCFWYRIRLRTMLTENTGLKYPNSKREHTEFWVMREKHGSRAWLVDIRRIGECPSNSPFLKNNGAEDPKGPRPIVFKEWRDTRTFSNLKSTHCTLFILLIINLVPKKKSVYSI